PARPTALARERPAGLRAGRDAETGARGALQRLLRRLASLGAEGLAAGGQRLGARALRERRLVSAGAVEVAEQQKDNLCGPFWAMRVLRESGIERWAGQTLARDMDAVRVGRPL